MHNLVHFSTLMHRVTTCHQGATVVKQVLHAPSLSHDSCKYGRGLEGATPREARVLITRTERFKNEEFHQKSTLPLLVDQYPIVALHSIQ